MKKIYSLLIVLAVALLPVNALEEITLGGVVHKIDTTAVYPIGPGTTYIEMVMKRPDRKELHVFQTIIDRTNPNVSFEAYMGNDSILWGEVVSSVAKRHSKEGHKLFTGTNGDFYRTSGNVGLPIGAAISCNQLAYTPNNNKPEMAFDENNVPYIGVIKFNGSIKHKGVETAIDHVNFDRNENELVLYNQLQGKYTRTNEYGTEIIVDLCKGESWGNNKDIKVVAIEKITRKGCAPIKKNGAVLSGHGTGENALSKIENGDTVTIRLNTTLDGQNIALSNALGGDPRSLMLKDGIVEENDVWNENHPRTAFGFSQTKDSVITCVVDGRGRSIGCTTKVLAEIMKSAGAYSAVNLDGGGSSTMYVSAFGAMNHCSDGHERAVSNCWFTVNNAPEDNSINQISADINQIKLPKYGVYTPTVFGYNKYGALINTDITNYKLSCDKSLGYIVGNRLVADGEQNGYLNIEYNGAKSTVFVIKDNNPEFDIRLDSVLIDQKDNYEIEIESTIGMKTQPILPKALKWTIENPEVCEITDGFLKAKENGNTLVIGELNDRRDTIKVTVEKSDAAVIVAEDWNEVSVNDWTVKASSSSWKTKINPSSENETAKLSFNYTGGRVPNIQLTTNKRIYSKPQKVAFTFNPNGAAFKNIIISIDPDNAKQPYLTTFENIASDKEQTLTINMKDIVDDKDDMANYPMVFNYIKFNIDFKNMTNKKDYLVELKKIEVIYDEDFVVEIENVESQNTLDVYPNPAKDVIYVPTESVESEYKIYNINGQCVMNGILDGNNINIGSLNAGTYIINVNNKTSKLIIR